MVRGRFRWSSAALSDVGLVRRINEDAGLDLCERGLWAVADGMGGHDFGAVASSMLVQALAYLPPCRPLAACIAAARERLREVNDELRTTAAARSVPMMGTTVVTLLAVENECAVLWAGDSRAYLMRRGQLRQISRDHRQTDAATLPATDRAAGSATGLSAASPGRSDASIASNIISRAVGAAASLLLDEIRVPVEDGDFFLLCSDGLTNMVTDREIAEALLHGSCRQATQLLIALALQYGAPDNVTVVVVTATDLDSSDRTVFNPAV